MQISLINLNDGTCAGMYYPSLQALTVQSHPEASPGPHDSDVAFVQFIDMMKVGFNHQTAFLALWGSHGRRPEGQRRT